MSANLFAEILDRVTGGLMLLEPGDHDSHAEIQDSMRSVLEKLEVLAMLDENAAFGALLEEAAELSLSLERLAEADEDSFVLLLVKARDAAGGLQRRLFTYGDKGPSERNEPPAVSTASPDTPAVEWDRETFMDFFAESEEHLQNAETLLLDIERNPRQPEAVKELFRGMHSIKGMAGFLGLTRISGLTHRLESLLDILREGVVADAPVLHVLLGGTDMIKRLVAEEAERMAGRTPTEIDAAHFDAMKEAVQLQIDRLKGGGSAEAAAPPPATAETSEPRGAQAAAGQQDSIKVRLERIDALVNMVGEIVITHNQIQERVMQTVADAALLKNIGQMHRIVTELQELTLTLRMVPINATFRKLVRLVRDFQTKSGKKIETIVSGEGTELDRNVIEELADPLIHLARNSIDHGIESPEDRRAAGKPETGRVGLNAYHQSGMVVIEISDDGRGLDRERILQKGIEKGLVAEGAALSDAQIYNLIFHPGFSTAAVVTDVSGRGVGMDVVKSNIERLRGKVELETTLGAGTTVKVMIPLTLAIIDGMIVRLGADRFVIATTSIVESFRPKREQVSTVAGGGELVMVRGSLLPLIRLHRLFDMTPDHMNPWESLVIIIQSAGRQFGLMVDELVGQQQVVIKSLGRLFRDIEGISGGAIMGDGKVGLILDPEKLSTIAAKA